MITLRTGPGYWWTSYRAMLRWELTNLRLVLPVTVMVQMLSGAGFVLGVGLFFAVRSSSPSSAPTKPMTSCGRCRSRAPSRRWHG